jgi:hypothetical protein
MLISGGGGGGGRSCPVLYQPYRVSVSLTPTYSNPLCLVSRIVEEEEGASNSSRVPCVV